jgi:hypothetical protein
MKKKPWRFTGAHFSACGQCTGGWVEEICADRRCAMAYKRKHKHARRCGCWRAFQEKVEAAREVSE